MNEGLGHELVRRLRAFRDDPNTVPRYLINSRFFHSASHPLISNFSKIGSVYTDLNLVLDDLQIIPASNADLLSQLSSEFNNLSSKLKPRYERKLNYPKEWALEDKTSLLLYSMVRLFRPKKILETGVANGHSTFYILHALKRNGVGELHSTDVSNDVGKLVDEDETSNWHLHILDTKRPKSSFRDELDKIGKLNLFIHDSNHNYYWQYLEYSYVYEFLIQNSILCSDDVDWSNAFSDFSQKVGARPLFFFDVRKIFGILKKTN